MHTFEYKVVPAPRKGKSAKGVRGSEAKFAHALTLLMNELGADGWDYIRADTLPVEERSGLTSKTTVYHNMLVFRRPLPGREDVSKADNAPEVTARPAPALLTAVVEPAPPHTDDQTTDETDAPSTDPGADVREEPSLTAERSTSDPLATLVSAHKEQENQKSSD